MAERHAVTGAYGYSGRYIAHRLIEAGHDVITLTNTHPTADPFEGRVQPRPLNFSDPASLAASLDGVSVLYNTYWVRFNHKQFTHEKAVCNTLALFTAARATGVRRIVHISITNPCGESSLSYFRGKARLEQALIESGLSYAILRPAVLFGGDDILINNIAWMLRRLPVFGIFGDGDYRLQPIHVDDLARLAVTQGSSQENAIINAIGPETFTYRELVQTLGAVIGHPRPIMTVPPVVGYWAGMVAGKLVGDVVITRDEIRGLMAGLLHVDAPPTGETRLTEWAREHAATLGQHYANELARRKATHTTVWQGTG